MKTFDRRTKTCWISCAFWIGLLFSAWACTNPNLDRNIYPEQTRPALELIDTCPGADATDISTSAVIRLAFSKELDPETVNLSSFILGSGPQFVLGNVFYEDGIVTYVPNEPLIPDSLYRLYVTSDLRDIDGFAYTNQTAVFSFFTGDGEQGTTCRYFYPQPEA